MMYVCMYMTLPGVKPSQADKKKAETTCKALNPIHPKTNIHACMLCQNEKESGTRTMMHSPEDFKNSCRVCKGMTNDNEKRHRAANTGRKDACQQTDRKLEAWITFLYSHART